MDNLYFNKYMINIHFVLTVTADDFDWEFLNMVWIKLKMLCQYGSEITLMVFVVLLYIKTYWMS